MSLIVIGEKLWKVELEDISHGGSSFVVGLFRNCRLGYLLPRYGPMVLGRRVRTSLTATHPKPACAQTKTPLLKLWSDAHGKGNCYKRVMVDRYNITTTKGKCLLSARKQEIPNRDFNKGGDNAL